MNRISRLVFNRSHGLIQVASELGSTAGKGMTRAAGKRAKKPKGTRPARTPIAVALAVPVLLPAPVQATTLASHTGASGGIGGAATTSSPGTGGIGAGSGSTANDGGQGASYPGGPYGGQVSKYGYGSGGMGALPTTSMVATPTGVVAGAVALRAHALVRATTTR